MDIIKVNLHNKKQINVDEDFERRYWAGRLNCASEELEQAVEAVGPDAREVEAYLRKTRLN